MSKDTFTVRPLTEDEIEVLENRRKALKLPMFNKVTHFTCSFCGQSVHYQKYADHVEKQHPGGRLFKPFPKSKPNPLLLLECQQADAGPDDDDDTQLEKHLDWLSGGGDNV